MNNIR